MRLQKFMAHAGVGSLRACERLIAEGKVTVNGERVTQMGTDIDPEKDIVVCRGKKVEDTGRKVTVLLNKPEGYITTAKDQFGRPSVVELVKVEGLRLYPVGRLDYQTTGALLLTNDGDLTQALTHPRHHIAKTYLAIMKGQVTGEEIERLKKGVTLDDGYHTKPAKARLTGMSGRDSKVELTIYEGKNHQVRRMAKAIGHPVLRLQRISVGGLTLGNLKPGQYRELTEQEVRELKNPKETIQKGKNR